MPADRPQKNSDCDSQPERECDEIPQRGESEDKDECAAGGEEKADESASEGNLVHGDAGMGFRHWRTSQARAIISPGAPGFKASLLEEGRILFPDSGTGKDADSSNRLCRFRNDNRAFFAAFPIQY